MIEKYDLCYSSLPMGRIKRRFIFPFHFELKAYDFKIRNDSVIVPSPGIKIPPFKDIFLKICICDFFPFNLFFTYRLNNCRGVIYETRLF